MFKRVGILTFALAASLVFLKPATASAQEFNHDRSGYAQTYREPARDYRRNDNGWNGYRSQERFDNRDGRFARRHDFRRDDFRGDAYYRQPVYARPYRERCY